ncbi:hypothetical protein SAMN04488128_101261 [Chitinophaga eiseniae]|uniref:Uncharacterized protein n=2 Tax=Chitinophaga eiseniae TaxID=634771 RepID=A0A1T4KR27_9BACT|nr:hypothetical protein SAMN04488128_101261 [Chitinophaga eiseniae]
MLSGRMPPSADISNTNNLLIGREYIEDHEKKGFDLSYAFTWFSVGSLLVRSGVANRLWGFKSNSFGGSLIATSATTTMTTVTAMSTMTAVTAVIIIVVVTSA